MSKRLAKILKVFLLIFVIIVVIVFGIVELASPCINRYRTDIEQYASSQVGKPVRISRIQTGWYYFEPVIRLSGVTIEDGQTHIIAVIGKINLGVSWLSSLFHWKFEPGILVVSQLDIHLSTTLTRSTKPSLPLSAEQLEKMLPVITRYKKIILNNVNLQWQNNTGNGFPSFEISDAYLRIKRKIGGYYVKTDLNWHDKLYSHRKPTHLFAGIVIANNFLNKMRPEGSFFLEIQQLNFPEIQKRIMPYVPYFKQFNGLTIEKGRGDIQFHGNIESSNNSAEDWKLTEWSVLANLDNVGWKVDKEIQPSVKGLSGTFFIEPDQGSVHINSHNLEITYPKFFNHSLPFSETNVQFQWQKMDSQWILKTQKLFLENPQISLNGKGNIKWKKGISDAIVQFDVPFVLHDLPAIRQYLPDNVMKPKLKVWLHRSIIGGTVTTGSMTLNGKLVDFPFDPPNKSNGLFLVDSYFQQFTLDFKEGWPAGKLMDAHVIFRNRDLIAEIHNGTIDQLPLTDVKAQILALGKGKETLQIQGHLKADASKARHFVLNSPLIEHLSAFKSMELAGSSIFDINIEIPLYPQNDKSLVNGKAIFLNNTLILTKWWNLHFDHFKGQLVYDQDGIVRSNFNANLLNYPLQLKMKTVKKPVPATLVDVKGTLGIDALHKIFPIFIFDFVKGATSYTAQLILTTSKKLEDQVILKSDLEGISINLPKPYEKKASTKQSLLLNLIFSDDESSPSDTKLKIDYANLLSLYLGYQPVYHSLKKDYLFHRGHIVLGQEKAAEPKTEGLVIEGNVPEFSLEAWMPFLKAMQTPKKAQNGNAIQSVQIKTPLFKTNYESLHNANIVLYPKNDFCKLQIKSDELLGDIQIASPVNAGVTANLNYLHLNTDNSLSDSTKNKTVSSLAPMDIPPLNIKVKDFKCNKMNLGAVQLITQRDSKDDALVIKTLVLKSPSTTGRFLGVWKKEKNQSITQIRGTLSSSNFQQTLQNFGIDPVIQGNKGEINVDLHWLNTPEAFDPAILNGSASLLLKKGVITHLTESMQDKIGMGKLLSLFSLQTLPQHLTLDFSDLSAKGLSFDVLKGNFSLKQGRMRTQDTVLEGPIADVAMKGLIDMNKKVYDVMLNITPAVSSGIPVIATIAGGPVLGLATLAATTLIHQGMKQTSMYRYQVIGPWSHPTVKSY